MAVYLFTGTIPATDDRAEIDLSTCAKFSASKCVLLLMQAKIWAPGAAGGYSFQPAIFNTNFDPAGFAADAHLDEAPALCWGAQSSAAVTNTKVFLGGHDESQLRVIVSDSQGLIWLYPAKGTSGETTHYEIVFCTEP